MKLHLIALLFLLPLFTACANNSSEDKICHCIQENFKLVGLDYFQILEEVEADLIKNKIIDQSPESRLQQLQVMSKRGQIGVNRTYESVILELIGIKTVKHCVNLISYSASYEITGAFRMFQEMDFLTLEHSQDLDLINLRKESAQILLEYNDKFSPDSQLWKIIQLEYLYWFSDFGDIKTPRLFTENNENEIIPTNKINIQVAANDTIKVDGELVKLEELCAFISSRLNEKIDIDLTNKRNTRYYFYLDVFKEIHACFNKKRDDKSMEMFQKNYEDLSKEELEKIDKMMSIRIVEYAPQR